MWEQIFASETAGAVAAAEQGLEELASLGTNGATIDVQAEKLKRALEEVRRIHRWNTPLPVVIFGAGMITQLQLGPSLLQGKRIGHVGPLSVINPSARTLHSLVDSDSLAEHFPDVSFDEAWDAETNSPGEDDRTRACMEQIEKITRGKPGGLVMIATPEHTHADIVMHALSCGQNVAVVKPLALSKNEWSQIKEEAYKRGLLVLVEYHKLEELRYLVARDRYNEGAFGEFTAALATMIEDDSYLDSGFGKWFNKTNPFVYVGCHYFGIVNFITGQKAVEVTVTPGADITFSNGVTCAGFTTGVIKYENGATLTVLNGIGIPEKGAPNNDQGLKLLGTGGAILYNDAFRGMEHTYREDWEGTNGRPHRYLGDYWQMVTWEGKGKRPIGYGYRQVDNMVQTVRYLEALSMGLEGEERLQARQKFIEEIDALPFLAAAGSDMVREEALINEAAFASLKEGGGPVRIPGR